MHRGGCRYNNGMEHLIEYHEQRFQVRREVSVCRLVEGGLGFDAAGDLQTLAREGTDGDWN